MIIYKTTNLINGKFYIGQDSKNNSEYLGSGKLLNRAINKYGIKNFKKETLEVCKNKKHLNEREIYWIEKTEAKKYGYNIADGGHGGNTYNEEISKRISKQFKNRKLSPETIQKIKDTKAKNPDKYKMSEENKKKMSQRHKGKKHPEEWKKRQSEVMKKYYYSDDPKLCFFRQIIEQQQKEDKSGENAPNWGKKASIETRKKQSEAHKKNPVRYWLGKKQSEEHIKKRTEKQIGKKWSGDRRKKYEENGNSFAGKKHTKETINKIKEYHKHRTPEEKLVKYVKFHISRFGFEPSEQQKKQKLQEYRNKK